MHRVSEISTQVIDALRETHSHQIQVNESERRVNKGHRTLMVVIYSLVNIGIGIFGSPLTPFSKTAKSAYDKPLDTINLSTSVWSFCGLFSGFLANYLLGILGIRKSLVLSTFFFFAGMVVKNFININYIFVLIGQGIAGLGGPFCSYGTANFAAHWFTGPKVKIQV